MVVNRNAKHKLGWRESDARYKDIGRRMAIEHDPEWDDELEEMNKNKVGRPYKYSHGMMAYVAITRALLDASYRVLEGFLDGSWGKEHAIPEFTTIWKRIGKTMPRFEQEAISSTVEGRVLRLVIDGTGVAMHNRGEWIRVKWNVKRGFFKLHLLIDLDTRRIISFSLTDMNGGDAGQLPELLSKVLRKYTGEELPLTGQLAELISDAATIDTSKQEDSSQKLLDKWMYEQAPEPEPPAKDEDAEAGGDAKDLRDIVDEELLKMYWRLKRMGLAIELRGDGGYDTRKIFSLLVALGIIPIIKVRINSVARAEDEYRARTLAVLEQLGGKGDCTDQDLNRMIKNERLANQKDWKERVRYGLRWIVEIVISAFKRVFGESVRALTPGTAYIEIATKVAAYNHNLDIGDAAVRRMRDAYEAAKLPRGQRQLWGSVA